MNKPLLLIASILLAGCISDDSDFVKERAAQYYESRGFTVIGYQGYNFNPQGRCYWYVTSHNDVTYESCLLKWGGELHEYSLKAVDAVRGGR